MMPLRERGLSHIQARTARVSNCRCYLVEAVEIEL